MQKIDSFLKETLQVDGQNLSSPASLPAASQFVSFLMFAQVSSILYAIHEDDEIYPNTTASVSRISVKRSLT